MKFTNSVSRKSKAVKSTPLPSPKKAKAGAQPIPKAHIASIYSDPVNPLPPEFVQLVSRLEKELGISIWLIIQNDDSDDSPWGSISGPLYKGFQASLSSIPQGKPLGLLIESPGGDAHYAYRLARILQRHTANQLTTIVPQYAKSAATLLSLGGSTMILGRDAELGPLDVQILDFEREDYVSALDSVQSLDRLTSFSMQAVDQMMILLTRKMPGKRTDVILPQIFNYVAHLLRPLFEKIDTLSYTNKSRELKVAEEYAVRLMRSTQSATLSRRIARQLVQGYPTHGFVIDTHEISTRDEPKSDIPFGLGLKLKHISPQVEDILRSMVPFWTRLLLRVASWSYRHENAKKENHCRHRSELFRVS